MPAYTHPARDTRFVLHDLLRVSEVVGVDADVVDSIVEEAGSFAADVVAPLNRVADAEGCTRHPDGSVSTPRGFREAYRAYAQSGWGTLALPEGPACHTGARSCFYRAVAGDGLERID